MAQASGDNVYVDAGADHAAAIWDLLGLAFGPDGGLNVAWTQAGPGGANPVFIGFSRQIVGH
jgi:hypothetical protein